MLEPVRNLQLTKTGWRFWIDIGGTFTDIVALDPQGKLHTHKLLSSNPDFYVNSALQGMRDVLHLTSEQALTDCPIHEVRLGTTIATNALLERTGVKTALLITKGLRDVLQIGYQNRPDIFALNVVLPQPLYSTVVEVDERTDAQGEVVQPLNVMQVTADLQDLRQQNYTAIAIVLLNSYQSAQHEQHISTIAQQLGFTCITSSAQLSPLIRMIPRGDTAVVNTYLTPKLRDYIDTIKQALGDTRLYFMQSNGGLAEHSHFYAKDAILSGPAGGVMGAVHIGRQLGIEQLVGFDMGGTSTDVFHYHGSLERSHQQEIAGIRLAVPRLAIHTIATGGGSICRYAAGELKVGPDSAGADPGPACYGKKGPLTITDCHLFLGHLQVESFPQVFGHSGDQPLDKATVTQKFTQLADQVQRVQGQSMSAQQLAQGFIELAVAQMAEAIRKISIAKGHDVRQYTLVSFGGAAGQHACAIAELLGIQHIISHPLTSVLSAVGIGLSALTHIQECNAAIDLTRLTDTDAAFTQLSELVCQALVQQGATKHAIQYRKIAYLAYQNSDALLPIPLTDTTTMQQAFVSAYQQLFGYILPQRTIEIRRLHVAGSVPADNQALQHDAVSQQEAPKQAQLAHAGNTYPAMVYQRCTLQAQQTLTGPVIVTDSQSCQLVLPDWTACLDEQGVLHMQQHATKQEQRKQDNLITRALFSNKLMAIAEQMGAQLQKTALSVPVKERLDFSCAIFTKQGELVANAPHIPIHLGSMGESVKAIIKQHADQMAAGDVYLLNSPYLGGTHLPDLTVISPVVIEENIEFFVASRAHHVDVGGKTPGSFPADSKTVTEEGVVFCGEKIVVQGVFLIDELQHLLTQVRYPARNPEQNIADIQAQIAANQLGITNLHALVKQYDLAFVRQQMTHILDHGEQCVQAIMPILATGTAQVTTDQGATIQVAIRVQDQQLIIDFTGTSSQQANNYNAPFAVTRAAVLYVIRTLIRERIPLNDGCFRPIQLIIPASCLLNPDYPAAVVAGNVETSQQVVDVLYRALGILAESQGTMNNLLFGDQHIQYYETLGGGYGAGDGFAGASAVHSHMTNSRLTDPEILEARFPVQVQEFSIRYGSGGAGRWQGGAGLTRAIKFLQAMQMSLLTSRRSVQPRGLAGGQPGASGENYLIKANGKQVQLPVATTYTVQVGDTVVVKTPGGGGYGAATILP